MGKSIAVFFACSALVILAASFMAPRTTVVGASVGCTSAYGVDPCVTGAIAEATGR